MRSILITTLLMLIANIGLTQANFKYLTATSDKEYNKSGQRPKIKETTVLSGNGQSKMNTLVITFKSRDPQEENYTIFIKGNLKRGVINGAAEVLQLEGINHEALYDKLKSESFRLIDLVEEQKPNAYVYYQGNDIQDGEFVKGTYIFKGTYIPDKSYIIHTRFYHLWEIAPETQSLELKYERYGTHYHEKMTPSDSIVITNYESGKKHVIYQVFDALVFGRDIFTLDGDYEHTEIFTTTKFGSFGWRRVFQKDHTDMLLSGISRNYTNIPFASMRLDQKNTYKEGTYYGAMEAGHPMGFGILITKDYYYEGYFNKGEFDGYGFYRQFEAESRSSVKLSLSCVGLFRNNRIVSGEIHYHTFYSLILEADSIVQTQPFPISRELASIPYPDKVEQGLVNPFELNGNGAKYEIRTPRIPEARLIQSADKRMFEQGVFNNDQLNGPGIKLCYSCPNVGSLKYTEAVFENGRPGKAYTDSLRAVYAAQQQLEMDSLWSEAPFAPGTIISKNGYYYYINRVRRHGMVDVIPIPVEKTAETKDGFAKKGITPYHYLNTGNEVLGSPYYAVGYIELRYEDANNYTATDLHICEVCNGEGSYLHYGSETVANQEQTTTREVVHDGDYYRITADVTRYSTTMVNVPTVATKECFQCHGTGCMK